ncbi:Pyridoxal phosphate-dependent transferase, major region, subdomain 2 [Ostreococcus tauri]|uniref:histidinol-phosphate transaminase n=1 Tax=Ostreococcus tauri TaxID=70448 RepID=A0A090M7D0_OSTTA|nr:Pyridoxal phosphate-dependent transferase, major region, subdomain 2 [Ostreococcus tauri]CEG00992.1 Pyridoxal phosphate-dependent transferase, major region, subdomain 2 [Ostreococcus tauri]|eukprot:XP_022840727.1 Pyridoxal phosphate-dependent transferase, major region, subdomain 2 [Ostreococcus tauri]
MSARFRLAHNPKMYLNGRGVPHRQKSSTSRTNSSHSRAKSSRTSNELITTDFVRKHIINLQPYTPIIPFEVLSEQLQRPTSEIIKLDANENPYGPPPEVYDALRTVTYPHIYPDPESRRLRAMLSSECKVPAENLLVGCGADELIDLLLRVVLEPGDKVINTPPTFGMYSFDSYINDGCVIDVKRGPAPSFRVDVDGIERAVAEHNPKILFLTSPNNPDGSVLDESDLERLLCLPVLVVLDEAYVEFSSSYTSRIAEVPNRKNLIVLRTFSKRAGLAGIRVGYGAFPNELIEFIWRVKQPYNVSVIAEEAAMAALSNPTYLQDVRDKIVCERARLFTLLSQFDFMDPFPSESNFILCRVTGASAEFIKKSLLARGIVIRYYSSPKEISDCIRISVGRPEDTDAIIAGLTSISSK